MTLSSKTELLFVIGAETSVYASVGATLFIKGVKMVGQWASNVMFDSSDTIFKSGDVHGALFLKPVNALKMSSPTLHSR